MTDESADVTYFGRTLNCAKVCGTKYSPQNLLSNSLDKKKKLTAQISAKNSYFTLISENACSDFLLKMNTTIIQKRINPLEKKEKKNIAVFTCTHCLGRVTKKNKMF